MGHSQRAKSESHDRIVQAAATRFRQHGVEGIGVADLMKEAGFTHGGFYRHFGSREELVAEATECALREGGRVVDALSSGSRASFAALVDAYLSATHRDEVAKSCAVATLAGDVARSNPRARAAYTRQVDTYLALLTRLISRGPRRSARTDRARAMAALAALVGAITLARAVSDEKLSRDILRSTADQLKAHESRRGRGARRR